MAIKKLKLSEDVINLISNIRFKKYRSISDSSEDEHCSYEIDLASIYGGDFILEDISHILGKYDEHIEGTECDYDGPKFSEELTSYMYDLHYFVLENLVDIEEIVHQFINKGGVKPGTYKCKSWQHIWEYIGD